MAGADGDHRGRSAIRRLSQNGAMAIRAVLFDIGGVLEINPPTGWPQRWARRLGITPDELGARLGPIWAPGSVGGLTLAEVEQAVAAELDLDAATCQELMEDVWVEYVGRLNHELAVYFTGLRPSYRTGIVSNSMVGAREREQAAHGLADLCETIVYSHEVGCAKPDPEIYRIACERLEVAPQQAVLLDDVDGNAAGAEAVGLHAVVFRSNRQAIAELDALLAAP
jgi:HAD superfamily hydrolase (TIGR01509 family)